MTGEPNILSSTGHRPNLNEMTGNSPARVNDFFQGGWCSALESDVTGGVKLAKLTRVYIELRLPFREALRAAAADLAATDLMH
jgi:hypothetical protein